MCCLSLKALWLSALVPNLRQKVKKYRVKNYDKSSPIILPWAQGYFIEGQTAFCRATFSASNKVWKELRFCTKNFKVVGFLASRSRLITIFVRLSNYVVACILQKLLSPYCIATWISFLRGKSRKCNEILTTFSMNRVLETFFPEDTFESFTFQLFGR